MRKAKFALVVAIVGLLAILGSITFAAEVSTWSSVAANNTSAPPDGAPEGWDSPDVNNWGREIMAAIHRWYVDPEFLTLFTQVVSKIDDDTIRITGVDVTALFSASRAVLVCNGGSCAIGFVSSASFGGGNTDVNLFFDFGEVVPAGTNSAKLAAAQNLGSAAYHDWSQVALDDFYVKKTTANQDFTSGSNTAVTTVGATITLPITTADGSKDFELYGGLSYMVLDDGDGLAICTFNLHLGTNGTTADSIIYSDQYFSAGLVTPFKFDIGAIRLIDPPVNSKLTFSIAVGEVSDTCRVFGSGTTATRFSRWGARELRIN